MPTLTRFREVIQAADPYDAVRLAQELSGGNYDNERILSFFHRLGIDLHTCDWTGDFFVSGTGYTTGDGDLISPYAYESRGFTCDSCDEIYRDSEMRPYQNRGQCCQNCRDNHLEYHEATGTWFDQDNLPDDDDDEDAESGDAPSSRLVHSYSFNVLDRKTGFLSARGERLPQNPRWLGVELEVEPRRSVYNAGTDYIRQTYDAVAEFAILKSDSSIADSGFEIVTVPATLQKHREMWKPFFEGPAKLLRSWHTDGRCGMHVHISRDCLSPLTLGCMLVFINDRATAGFIEAVAGRKSSDFSRRYQKKLTDGRKKVPTDHYDALSVSAHTNGATVELRIFKGNVSENGFFKNLDFADALVSFCSEASYRKIRTKDFLDWLALPSNRRTYPYLTGWAVTMGLLTGKSQRSTIELIAA